MPFPDEALIIQLMKRWLLIALTIAGLTSVRAKVSPEDLARWVQIK